MISLYLKGLLSRHLIPIFRTVFSLADLLNVDDTDLNVLNLSNKPVSEAITEAQNILNAWHFDLKASGGDLNLKNYSRLSRSIAGIMINVHLQHTHKIK